MEALPPSGDGLSLVAQELATAGRLRSLTLRAWDRSYGLCIASRTDVAALERLARDPPRLREMTLEIHALPGVVDALRQGPLALLWQRCTRLCVEVALGPGAEGAGASVGRPGAVHRPPPRFRVVPATPPTAAVPLRSLRLRLADATLTGLRGSLIALVAGLPASLSDLSLELEPVDDDEPLPAPELGAWLDACLRGLTRLEALSVIGPPLAPDSGTSSAPWPRHLGRLHHLRLEVPGLPTEEVVAVHQALGPILRRLHLCVPSEEPAVRRLPALPAPLRGSGASPTPLPPESHPPRSWRSGPWPSGTVPVRRRCWRSWATRPGTGRCDASPIARSGDRTAPRRCGRSWSCWPPWAIASPTGGSAWRMRGWRTTGSRGWASCCGSG